MNVSSKLYFLALLQGFSLLVLYFSSVSIPNNISVIFYPSTIMMIVLLTFSALTLSIFSLNKKNGSGLKSIVLGVVYSGSTAVFRVTSTKCKGSFSLSQSNKLDFLGTSENHQDDLTTKENCSNWLLWGSVMISSSVVTGILEFIIASVLASNNKKKPGIDDYGAEDEEFDDFDF